MRKTLMRAIYFVSVLVFFCAGTGSGQTQYPKSSIRSIDSELITSNSLRGKIVMLHFWFIGCAPCLNEIPDLSRLHAKYAGDTRTKFIAISINDTPAELKKFLRAKKFPFVQVANLNNPIEGFPAFRGDWATFYNVTRYPTSVILDGSGKVIMRKETIPQSSYSYYNEIIQSLL